MVCLLTLLGKGERARLQPERMVEEFFTGWLNKRIGQTLIKSLGLERGRTWASLTGGELDRIARTAFSVKPAGSLPPMVMRMRGVLE